MPRLWLEELQREEGKGVTKYSRGDRIARRGCGLFVIGLIVLEVWGFVLLYRVLQST